MADQTIKSTNITTVESRVTLQDRIKRSGHRGGVLWFTGLSGSGKSTLAIELERRLFNIGYNVFVLDGDNVRHGLSSNLGFSPEDRTENIRRIGEVGALFANAGFIVVRLFAQQQAVIQRVSTDICAEYLIVNAERFAA